MASECALKKGELVTLVPDVEGRINGHMSWGLKVRIDSRLIGTVGTVSCPLIKSGDVRVDLLPICHGIADSRGEPTDPVYVSPECVKPVEGVAFVCKTADSYAVFDRKDVKNPVAAFSTALNEAKQLAERLCSDIVAGRVSGAIKAWERDRFTIERNNYNISVIDNSIPEHNVILCLTNDYKAGTLDAETIANSLCAMLNAGCGEVSDAFVSMVGGKKGNP